MRKSFLFFLVNLSLIVALAYNNDETPVDNIADSKVHVSSAIEDGEFEIDKIADNN